MDPKGGAELGPPGTPSPESNWMRRRILAALLLAALVVAVAVPTGWLFIWPNMLAIGGSVDPGLA